MKKLLVLGGKPIGSYEIVEYAKSLGVYTVVTDYLPEEQSIAKKIADESWDISTADVEKLAKKAKEVGIDGIYTGVHEFNIGKMIELCSILKLPCFCTLEQWKILNNKRMFKDLCKNYNVPVTEEYSLEKILSNEESNNIAYPVVIKPVDGSGSRGFSVCYNHEELILASQNAMSFSLTKSVLVEKYMDYKKSVIINYTIVDGQVFFSGISDKYSKKVFENGSPIMSIQFYPSSLMDKYLNELNDNVMFMLRKFGLLNGVIWIESFYSEGKFFFNEMGYRFGGSLTYLPVKALTGIDQLELQIEYALTGKNQEMPVYKHSFINKTYCILPVHVKPGKIVKVEGIEEIESSPELVRIVPVHYVGDNIEEWGSAQQVFAYIHFIADNKNKAEEFIDRVVQVLKVYDVSGNNIVFTLYRKE